ncbi:MAG: hypothetical protein MHM6MM_009660 [Cercozoa sp. M6MM]
MSAGIGQVLKAAHALSRLSNGVSASDVTKPEVAELRERSLRCFDRLATLLRFADTERVAPASLSRQHRWDRAQHVSSSCLDRVESLIHKAQNTHETASTGSTRRKKQFGDSRAFLRQELRSEKPQDRFFKKVDNSRQFQVKKNPLKKELEQLKKSVPTHHLASVRAEVPLALNKRSVVWIDTVDEWETHVLPAMERAKTLALTVQEHVVHSYRGYAAVMCLSVSDGSTTSDGSDDTDADVDLLIDLCAPEVRRCVSQLRRVLADPAVQKVMCNATPQLLALQRDFGLFAAGVFDVADAHRVLSDKDAAETVRPTALLSEFLGQQETREWRRALLGDPARRPLSVAQVHALRGCTRYLHYVRARQVNALNRRDRVLGFESGTSGTRVVHLGIERCLEVYRPVGVKRTHSKLVLGVDTPGAQVAYLWRDDIARTLDESVDAVLPVPTLLSLCRFLQQHASQHSDSFDSLECDLLFDSIQWPSCITKEHVSSLVTLLQTDNDADIADLECEGTTPSPVTLLSRTVPPSCALPSGDSEDADAGDAMSLCVSPLLRAASARDNSEEEYTRRMTPRGAATATVRRIMATMAEQLGSMWTPLEVQLPVVSEAGKATEVSSTSKDSEDKAKGKSKDRDIVASTDDVSDVKTTLHGAVTATSTTALDQVLPQALSDVYGSANAQRRRRRQTKRRRAARALAQEEEQSRQKRRRATHANAQGDAAAYMRDMGLASSNPPKQGGKNMKRR